MMKSYVPIALFVLISLASAATAQNALLMQKKQIVTAIEMIDLPSGSYTMGLKAEEEHEQQAFPAHTVTIKPFRIAKTTVTFNQYDAFARITGRALAQDEGFGRGTRPVINVNRPDMLAFISWLNAGTGHHFRLPSEAEWEYAARGGTTSSYFWGDGKSADYANITGISGRDQYVTTAPVGSFLPNGFGLYDMAGNVWQAVEDCRHPNLVKAPSDGRAWIDAPCDSHIARGGWYGSLTRGSRVTARAAISDSFRSMALGFRLAENAISH
jgi:formylglycine-generating enzyme required for sulfatase activity